MLFFTLLTTMAAGDATEPRITGHAERAQCHTEQNRAPLTFLLRNSGSVLSRSSAWKNSSSCARCSCMVHSVHGGHAHCSPHPASYTHSGSQRVDVGARAKLRRVQAVPAVVAAIFSPAHWCLSTPAHPRGHASPWRSQSPRPCHGERCPEHLGRLSQSGLWHRTTAR